MSTLKTPFRYDFVGSFLRPQALKDAKRDFSDGKITKEEYDKIVNDAITKLYNSELYAILEQEDTKVWQYSTDMLYSLLEQEEKTGKIEFPDV